MACSELTCTHHRPSTCAGVLLYLAAISRSAVAKIIIYIGKLLFTYGNYYLQGTISRSAVGCGACKVFPKCVSLSLQVFP